MPIHVELQPERNLCIVVFTGAVTDEEMLEVYRQTYLGPEWVPGMQELVDLGGADLSALTTGGLERLSQFAMSVFETRGPFEMRTAIYAPQDLPFGLARQYQVMVDDSPEQLRVFRDRSAALAWLLASPAA